VQSDELANAFPIAAQAVFRLQLESGHFQLIPPFARVSVDHAHFLSPLDVKIFSPEIRRAARTSIGSRKRPFHESNNIRHLPAMKGEMRQ
jgi:hypothetical protein